MAWQEPFENWAKGSFVTHEDMNRITGNIKHIFPDYGGKTNWTNNDIISISDWNSIKNALSQLMQTTGYNGDIPGDEMIADTFNLLEANIRGIYERIGLNKLQIDAYVYPRSDFAVLYATDPCRNYVRGV